VGAAAQNGPWCYPDRSQKEAREVANAWRAAARQGLDPIKGRDRERREAARNIHMLSEIVLDAFNSRKAGLKGDAQSKGAARQSTPYRDESARNQLARRARLLAIAGWGQHHGIGAAAVDPDGSAVLPPPVRSCLPD